jgi:ABC-type branched-subunit amino acid transport system ATPase component
MTTPVLETRNLCMNFGALQVTHHVDFALGVGARHAIIGPNGAGKTTFINLITGALRPTAGQVLLHGDAITHLPESQRVKRGIARTFQINSLFSGLTVLENLYLAVSERTRTARHLLRAVGAYPQVVTEAWRLLELLHLTQDAHHTVAELPYGRQRLVEIAIALALQPKVLLLDEPAAGVPSTESHIILEAIEALPNDMAVLIIEHDMDIVFRFAQTITVLVDGAVMVSGAPRDIAANVEVKAVYLGERNHV